MGVTYRRLPSASRRGAGGGGGGVRARAWVVLRRAAARVTVQLYAARRSWAARCGVAGARRLTWVGLCGRGAAVDAAAPPPRRSSAAARAGYDSASYARNFDDGVWKAEEGVFWSTGSFARRFAHHATATATATTTTTPPAPASGNSISSSTNR